MPARMNAYYFLHALTHISAQIGQIGEIEVSMEKEGVLVSTFIPLFLLPFVSLGVSSGDLWSYLSRTSVFLRYQCFPSPSWQLFYQPLDNCQISKGFPCLSLVGLCMNPYDPCLSMLLIMNPYFLFSW